MLESNGGEHGRRNGRNGLQLGLQSEVNSTRRKRILIAIALLAIVALASVWMLRNSIIRELSGPLLAQYGLEITDVSLDAIATANASIGYLELRHSGGTTIGIDDLDLDVRKSAGGRRRYAAGRVTIALAESDGGESLELVALIRQTLALPDAVPLIDVAIGELRLAPYPAVQDLAWSTYADRQTFGARIGDNAIDFGLERTSEDRYVARLELDTKEAPPQTIRTNIEDTAAAIRLDTESALDLDALGALAERFELLPDDLEIESADATLSLHAEIPDAPAPAVTIDAVITPAADWRVRYADDTAVTIALPGTLDVAASFPGADWEVVIDDATVSIAHPSIADAVVTLAGVSCRRGIACAATARASANRIDIGTGSAESLGAAATLDVETDPGGVLRVTAAPGATASASSIVAGDSRIARLAADFVSETVFERRDGGWRVSADSIDATLDELATAGVTADSPLFLENPVVEAGDGGVSASTGVFTSGIRLTFGESAAQLPGLRGTVNLGDQRIVAELETVGLAADGRVNLSYDLSSGATGIDVAGAKIDFAKQPLSARANLPLPQFDLAAGALTIDASFERAPRRPLGGSVALGLADAAGFYSDIAFTGASTNLELNYRPMTGIEATPASASVAFVDVGVPLRNLEADYHLHIGEESIDVSGLTLDAFGGKITAEPFSLGTDSEPDTVLVHLQSMDIAEMMAIKEFRAVEVSGRFDADLPLEIGPDGITMDDGRLTGLPPGGVIRYRAGEAGDAAGSSPLGIAQKALSNFEYETLTADVDYDESGNLVVQMQLRGRNPDMEESRPVVLNLGVENNIPQMLRSLQASRNVQDVLERRVNR